VTDLNQSLIRHEGLKSEPYLDSRRLWTFAVGRCLETNPLTGIEWKLLLDAGQIKVTITNEGSLRLLDWDMTAAEHECEQHFAFWPGMDEIRRDVLIEMVFQMGIAKVQRFHQMLGFIASKDYARAAAAGRASEWDRIDSHTRAEDLMKQLETGT
jgi:lysozyme